MTTQVQADQLADLEQRLAEALQAHDVAVAEWEAQAQPIRARIERAEEEWFATGAHHHLKDVHVARRDLANLGPAPEESIGIGLLRGRIARLRGEA